MHRTPFIVICTAAIAAAAAPAHAGDLTPPIGPVQPTLKTLTEVEPRTGIRNDFDTLTPIVISEPGSYYLLEDILAFPNNIGIRITASNVSLDLNGFSVRGNIEVGSGDGIALGSISSPVRNIAVRNGTVIDFLGAGIEGTHASGTIIESIRVSNCFSGIIARNSSTVTHCVANNNSVNGIQVAFGSTASFCTAQGNGSDGIQAFDSVITGSAATGNSRGFFLSQGAAIGSVAINNTSIGIRATSNSLVSACSAVGSPTNISASGDTTVVNSND